MSATCHDCGAKPGEPHDEGCDVARCLQTGYQRLACFEEHDHGHDVWTGTWPGEAECREFGWFSVFSPETGWRRCGANEPGAMPDLNRLNGLSGEAIWDREQRRWVRVGQERRYMAPADMADLLRQLADAPPLTDEELGEVARVAGRIKAEIENDPEMLSTLGDCVIGPFPSQPERNRDYLVPPNAMDGEQ